MARSDDPEAIAWRSDYVVGAALGLLLGMTCGLSASPVVSTVLAGLVALLAALFGLAKDASRLPKSGSRRLIAFALAAVLATPAAVWVRTHDLLSPSLSEQKALLEGIGYKADSREFRETLRYLRFGLLPKDAVVVEPDKSGLLARRSTALYANDAAGFCDDLARLDGGGDVLLLLERSGDRLRALGRRIEALPADKRAGLPDVLKLVLCSDA